MLNKFMDSQDKGKGREVPDGLFLERLETLYDRSLADLRAFAQRESRPFDEVRTYVAQWHCRYLFGADKEGAAPLATDSRERVSSILQSTSHTLELLHDVAGMHVFFLAVNPQDPADEGFLGGTLLGREFWRRHRGCGAPGAKAFHTFCTKAAMKEDLAPSLGPVVTVSAPLPLVSMPATKKGPASSLKAEVYSGIRDALRTASGFRNAEMKWRDHSKLSTYGIRLVGWPEDVPMQNPSMLTVAQNRTVLNALLTGTMTFVRKDGALIVKEPDQTAENNAEDDMDISWAWKDPDEVDDSTGAVSAHSSNSMFTPGHYTTIQPDSSGELSSRKSTSGRVSSLNNSTPPRKRLREDSPT